MVEPNERVDWAVHSDRIASGDAAGSAVVAAFRRAIADHGEVRVIFASAPSQQPMIDRLRAEPDLPWERVTAFHMDEYTGLPMEHPSAFGQWLADRLPVGEMKAFHRLDTTADPAAEAARYEDLLRAEPIDVGCLGIGVNGHLAFNEPNQCTFDDPIWVRPVTLDQTSRQQQVDDDCFDSYEEVPTHALSLTIPALLSARDVVVTVSGTQKSAAVAEALTGPVGPACPGSALRTHAGVQVFLDEDAAAKLS